MGLFGMSEKTYLKNQRENILHEIERWKSDRKVRIDNLPNSKLKTSHLKWNQEQIEDCEMRLQKVEHQLRVLEEEKLAKQAAKKPLSSRFGRA